MKKFVLGFLTVFFVAVIISTAVHYFSLPNITLVFDYKGSAYELSIKKVVRKRIQLEGYSNISHVTPNEDGYFCYGQNGDAGYFLKVKNGLVVSSVQLPQHRYTQIFDTATYKNNLIVNYSFEDDTNETSHGNQKLVQVDFEGQKIVEIPISDEFWISDLQTNGETILLGSYTDTTESYDIYLYENQQLTHLTSGFHPVFLNDSEFLYYSFGETKQFDLSKRNSESVEYKTDLKKHTAFDSFSPPRIAGKWSVGFRPGVSVHQGENLFSRIAFCNVDTGKNISLWSTIGMHISNVEILEFRN